MSKFETFAGGTIWMLSAVLTLLVAFESVSMAPESARTEVAHKAEAAGARG